MKRIFAIVMAAVVALCLTACGGETAPQEVEVTSDVLVRSDFDGLDRFTNSFTGVAVKMPGDWYVATDSEVVALMYGGEVTSGEFSSWTAADFAKQQIVPDFIVQDLANGNNMNVMFENMAVSGDVSVQEYIGMLEQAVAAMGSTVTEKGTVQLCGMEFDTVITEGTTNGVPMVQYQAVRRFGDWMMIVTATDMTGMGESSFWMMFE